MPRLYALLLVLFILIPVANIIMVRGVGYGYLAIKDYLGTVWTVKDVEKIINTTVNTDQGPKSLADYFWVVIDNDYRNKKYSLRNFTKSPLDGKTAVLPLPAGDHYVDIYWFGYHQRQLVHIVENQHYVLNLKTAPVVPLKTAGRPPSSAEWDLATSPDGLVIQRRDGKASVRFAYNQSYIEVKWYDKDLGGWQYQDLDIYIDTNYQYRFHIRDPANSQTRCIRAGSFLWLSWTTYKVAEKVEWNRTGEILHVTYTVVVNENKALLDAVDKVWKGVAESIIGAALKLKPSLIDPVTGSILDLKGFVDFVQGSYDAFINTVYKTQYTSTVVIIWDVFVTPTQIVVLAHCYYVDQNGKVTPKPITSANAFTINNRLVYIKRLGGGVERDIYYSHSYGGKYYYYFVVYGPDFACSTHKESFDWLSCALPMLSARVTDLSLFHYEIWYMGPWSLSPVIEIEFDDPNKANLFEQQLIYNNIQYKRDENKFTITLSASKTIFEDFKNIERLIPSGSSGRVSIHLSTAKGYMKFGAVTIHYRVAIMPKISPPRIILLKDGYQTVNGAFAVQVYFDLYREDRDAYMLGYYVLGNEPPPSYIIRDVHYDIEHDMMHYVYTIISADCYGQDIVDEKENGIVFPDNYILEVSRTDSTGGKLVVYRDRIYIYYGGTSKIKYWITLKNGTVINGTATKSVTISFKDIGITINDVKTVMGYPIGFIDVEHGLIFGCVQSSYTGYKVEPAYYNWTFTIPGTLRLFNNVTLALFSYGRMAFLNLAPEVIKYLLALPPSQGGYGTPIIDWSTVSTVTINTTRPYQLYYYDESSSSWIRVYPDYDNTSITYHIKRISDNVVIESIPNHNMSKYYYKLIYTDTNETLKGWLWNDNGTLRMITGSVAWSLTPEELDQLLQQVQIKAMYEQWLQQWNQIAGQLGLIPRTLQGIMGAVTGGWNWLYGNRWLILGGILLFFVLVLLLLVMSAGARSRVVIVRR